MTLSNLYFRGCFEPLSSDQKDAVDEVNGPLKGDGVVDKSCSRASINTCGMSIEQLFATYPIYNPQKGLYSSWGDIEFPWEISPTTPGLIIADTDDKWGVATYSSVYLYRAGARVLVIEDDGYRVSLYEAKEDILVTGRAFNSSKWRKICHVETTIPAGLPTIAELRRLYKLYELKFFDGEWGEYKEDWDEPLLQQSITFCNQPGRTIAQLEKCLAGQSSDMWKQARVRRQFFYRAGAIVLVDGECGDTVCVYIATQDIPATEAVYAAYQKFSQYNPAWQKIYCVPTHTNRCLEYQRRKEPALGYDVVEIGTQGHFVEMPVAYRLSPPTRELNEMVELGTVPRVLTQAQIDALNQPQEEE